MQMLGLNQPAFTCCKRADRGRQIGEQEFIPVGCIYYPFQLPSRGVSAQRSVCLRGACPKGVSTQVSVCGGACPGRGVCLGGVHPHHPPPGQNS